MKLFVVSFIVTVVCLKTAQTNSEDPGISSIPDSETTRGLPEEVQCSLSKCGSVLCNCDSNCTEYGDCCVDHEYIAAQSDSEMKFKCISNQIENNSAGGLIIQYYWTIATCQNTFLDRGDFNSRRIAKLCEFLPKRLLTDKSTGYVYKNEYCALCNDVSSSQWTFWNALWLCRGKYNETISAHITNNYEIALEDILKHCNPGLFQYSSLKNPPRQCYPLVRTCPSNDTDLEITRSLHDELIQKCAVQPINARMSDSTKAGYKNLYCGLCNEPNLLRTNLNNTLGCVNSQSPHFSGITPIIGGSFTLLLDVKSTGQTVLHNSSVVVTTTSVKKCPVGQVYDTYINACRATLCDPGYLYIDGEGCTSRDVRVQGNDSLSSGPDGHDYRVRTPTPQSDYITCVGNLITLNETEYVNVSLATVHWLTAGVNITIVGYNNQSLPIVCTNFSENFGFTFNRTVTVTTYVYPIAFGALSYVGLSTDVIAAVVYLITYLLFKDLRTEHTMLLTNLVIAILLGDAVFLFGTAIHSSYPNLPLCQGLAILLHYFFLTRFIWMTILCVNVSRYFYRSLKCIPRRIENNSKCKQFVLLSVSWVVALVIVTITTITNFTVTGAVGYGENGRCWINGIVAIVTSFFIPITLSILANTICVVFMVVVLIKVNKLRVKKYDCSKQLQRNFRVILAVLAVSGLTWIFGFIALSDSSQQWAWYPFIILSSTQALSISIANLCTLKVLTLYKNKMKCLLSRILKDKPRRTRKITPVGFVTWKRSGTFVA